MEKSLQRNEEEVSYINSYMRSGCRDSLVSLYRQAHIYFCSQHTAHNTRDYVCAARNAHSFIQYDA